MTALTDHELLAEFARTESEEAFATLVARHVNLVYSVALRFTGNPHHAQEITQAVFIILARKAGKLSPRVVLSGWLYQTTRLTAANFLKAERRREQREQEAYMESTLNEPDAAAWEQIAPLLDEAMGSLGETDRNAVVLRFFDNKTAAEVAAALKTTEAAAHKRVNRALEKLRKIFSKRGVTLSAVALAGAVSANSVHAAPVGLAATVIGTTAKGVTISAAVALLVKSTLNLMAWAKAKVATAITAGLLFAAGTTVVISHTGPGEPAFVTQLKQQCGAVYPRYRESGGRWHLVGLLLFNASESAFATLTNAERIEDLEFEATDLRTPAFQEVGRLTSLKRLAVVNCKLPPGQMKAIQNLTELEDLDLMFTVFEESREARAELLGELSPEEVQLRDTLKRHREADHVIQAALLTDRAMPYLTNLTRLKKLRLVNTFFTAKGLEQLTSLVNLEEADIGPVDLTGKTMVPLQGMKSLRSLRYFNADDEIVAGLSEIGSLEYLNIWSAGVTDAGAADLAKLKRLQRLEIRGNQMTDQGLEMLSQLPRLKHLDLSYAEHITEGGVERFRKLRPDVEITNVR